MSFLPKFSKINVCITLKIGFKMFIKPLTKTNKQVGDHWNCFTFTKLSADKNNKNYVVHKM